MPFVKGKIRDFYFYGICAVFALGREGQAEDEGVICFYLVMRYFLEKPVLKLYKDFCFDFADIMFFFWSSSRYALQSSAPNPGAEGFSLQTSEANWRSNQG